MMLDDMSKIADIDKADMRDTLSKFPQQCQEAVDIGQKMQVPDSVKGKDINKTVICGMGGSAIGGDILKTLFSDEEMVITASRDYYLPRFVDQQTLIFAVSYSGNTEETISSFKEAIGKGCPVVAVASGGQVEKIAQNRRVPFIKIPSGIPPRCAVGFLSIPLIILLEKILRKKSRFDYQEMVETISDIHERYLPEKKPPDNATKTTATRIKGKFPLIYGTNRLTDVVAHRLKTQFNENSKILASWDVFPEMNHNEIVPFSGEGKVSLQNFYPIFIRDREENPRISQRISITQQLLKKRRIGYSEIWTEGESPVTRVFSSIYIGDWVSFYLAILQEVDPTPVKFIDLLKDELKK